MSSWALVLWVKEGRVGPGGGGGDSSGLINSALCYRSKHSITVKCCFTRDPTLQDGGKGCGEGWKERGLKGGWGRGFCLQGMRDRTCGSTGRNQTMQNTTMQNRTLSCVH